MALLGGVGCLSAFHHNAVCGFQSFERKFEIALAKPGKQAVQPAGELGVFLKADLLPEYFLRPDLLNPSVDNAKHLGLDETIELGCQLAVARRCNRQASFLLALGNAQQLGIPPLKLFQPVSTQQTSLIRCQ